MGDDSWSPFSLAGAGPVQDVLGFFAGMGFDCPQRKDVPSFLLEVTTIAGVCAHSCSRVVSEGHPKFVLREGFLLRLTHSSQVRAS